MDDLALSPSNLPPECQIQPRGYVYFITDGYAVKIGYSLAPTIRINDLQIGSSWPLRIMATMPGDPIDEENMHAKFHDLRMHGEWFRASSRLLTFIETLGWENTEMGHPGQAVVNNWMPSQPRPAPQSQPEDGTTQTESLVMKLDRIEAKLDRLLSRPAHDQE